MCLNPPPPQKNTNHLKMNEPITMQIYYLSANTNYAFTLMLATVTRAVNQPGSSCWSNDAAQQEDYVWWSDITAQIPAHSLTSRPVSEGSPVVASSLTTGGSFLVATSNQLQKQRVAPEWHHFKESGRSKLFFPCTQASTRVAVMKSFNQKAFFLKIPFS